MQRGGLSTDTSLRKEKDKAGVEMDLRAVRGHSIPSIPSSFGLVQKPLAFSRLSDPR